MRGFLAATNTCILKHNSKTVTKSNVVEYTLVQIIGASDQSSHEAYTEATNNGFGNGNLRWKTRPKAT